MSLPYLHPITDSKSWNDFIIQNCKFYSFLQSWEWGEFQELSGSRVWRWGIFEEFGNEKKQIGVIQIFKVQAKRGTHLFCPHGPLITNNYFQVLEQILPQLEELAQKEGAGFIRFNPVCLATVKNQQGYQKTGFRNAPMHVHAETTWILDLKDSKEEIISNFRKTTRYLVRRAEKEGVIIKINNSRKEIVDFFQMHLAHSRHKRGGKYTAFSQKYIENLFQVFDSINDKLQTSEFNKNNQPQIQMMSAWYENYCEARLVWVRFGKFGVFYLAASDIRHPKFSPSYLLQWHAIQAAQETGCHFWNFWGVAPNDDRRHPIYGVSQFKKGFGGFGYELLHAQDLVINKWKYWLNWIIETIRRHRRGYFYPQPASEKDFLNQKKLE